MGSAYRVIAFGCLFVSLCATAQVGHSIRKIVLPNPHLIHCRSAECSQLWKGDAGAVYPAQILTDLVNGEVVGLTAVYDKSVSIEELQAAINMFYGKWSFHSGRLWRVEPEQLAIQVGEGSDGAKEVIYLKFGTFRDHVPSAHIDCNK